MVANLGACQTNEPARFQGNNHCCDYKGNDHDGEQHSCSQKPVPPRRIGHGLALSAL
jgi:hypothetical protein